MYFHVQFFHDIKFWANNQYKADQIFVKYILWSGPYKVPFWVVLILKELKLGQCLDIDDMTSPSKFGEVTWPTSNSMGQTSFFRHFTDYFVRHHRPKSKSFAKTDSLKKAKSSKNDKFQVFLMSRTEIGILQGPDQSMYFARFFENMVWVVSIFG